MHLTNTPLFATECFGYTISHVSVFPTHVTFCRKYGRDISVPLHMIASVEEHVYEHGFVILKTISRRRIICTVSREQADALYTAIREAQHAA